jgi:uridylate kinase
MEKPILICAAEEPGHSSDVDAVKIAKRIGTNILYRLTNVDAIYTSDPKSNPDAQPIHKLTWDKYFEVLGINEFTPGGHYPVDPVASKMSNEADLIFYLMDGENLENFSRSLRGEDFKGSIITNTVSEI